VPPLWATHYLCGMTSAGHVNIQREVLGSAAATQGERATGRIGGEGFSVTETAWVPRVPMDLRRWIECGQRLGRVGAGASWWLGDWLCYGNSVYGEKYSRAARITGYDPQTLMNYAYVASRFDVGHRRNDVSWSHHAELAPLGAADQTAWLERVVREHLSVKDLRGELRAGRTESRRTRSAGDAESVACCTLCGRPFARGTRTTMLDGDAGSGGA